MKRILLGTLAAAVLSASAAAQSDQQPTHAELVQHWAEASIGSQLKSMKTGLGLTADQETLWGTFESAVKDGAKARVVALQKEQSDRLSPMDRNLAKANRLAQGQANLETMVQAAKPLYATLDETQKHKFITLGRMLVPERGQFVKAMRRLH
jgi:LTXXQ motif family protein